MKTLEKILGYACAGLMALVNTGTLKSDILDYVNPESIEIISSSSGTIGKSTTCKNYMAWTQEGNIYLKNKITNETSIIPGNNPNLDSVSGNKLVYDKEGGIYMYNLETITTKTIYSRQNKIATNPKINNENIVFRLYNDVDELESETGDIIAHIIPEGVSYPISRDLPNRKTNPDIFNSDVIWTEELDSLCYPENKKFSINVYNLEIGNQVTFGENFVTHDISNATIYGNALVGLANYNSWSEGPSDLVIYRIKTNEDSNGIETAYIEGSIISSGSGEKENIAMHDHFVVWQEPGGCIKGVDLNSSGISINQFTIADSNCYNPDVYVNLNNENDPNDDTYYVSYIHRTDPASPQNVNINSTFTEINQLYQAEIIPYPGPSKCGDRGTFYLQGDFNNDCYKDFEDLRIFSESWLTPGLDETYQIDSNDPYNWDPNNTIWVCEVAAQTIGEKGEIINFDLYDDCNMDFKEMSIFVENWMSNSDPASPNCIINYQK